MPQNCISKKPAKHPLTGPVAIHIIHNSEKRFFFYEWTFAEKHIRVGEPGRRLGETQPPFLLHLKN